jgi:hypothetical protein
MVRKELAISKHYLSWVEKAGSPVPFSFNGEHTHLDKDIIFCPFGYRKKGKTGRNTKAIEFKLQLIPGTILGEHGFCKLKQGLLQRQKDSLSKRHVFSVVRKAWTILSTEEYQS